MPNDKQKNTLILILLVCVFLVALLAIGWFVGKSTLNNKQSDNLTPEMAAYNQNIESLKDLGTIIPYTVEPVDKSKVPFPTVEELNTIYLEVRKAYSTRDYDLFLKLASKDRIWNLQNRKDNSYEYNGQIVFKTVPTNGIENFDQNGLIICAHTAPDVSLIEPLTIQTDNIEYSNNGDYLLIDLENGTKKTIKEPPGPAYRLILSYNLKQNDYQNGFGEVVFVYEDGAWKYHFEDWYQTVIKQNTIVGDAQNSKIVISLDQSINGKMPDVTINSGDTVSWKSILGLVYTISPTVTQWNSPFLNNSTYVKRFDLKGEYTYRIIDSYKKYYYGKINVL